MSSGRRFAKVGPDVTEFKRGLKVCFGTYDKPHAPTACSARGICPKCGPTQIVAPELFVEKATRGVLTLRYEPFFANESKQR